MKLLINLVDKALFAGAALIGLQLPAFIQQYTQRIGGHLDEAISQLDKYRNIAHKHFEGDLNTLIDNFITSNNEKLVSVGQLVQDLMERVKNIRESLTSLKDTDLWQQIYYLSSHLDKSVAQATLENFQWSVPLTIEAGICAIIAGVIVTITFNLFWMALVGLWDFITGSSKPEDNQRQTPQFQAH